MNENIDLTSVYHNTRCAFNDPARYQSLLESGDRATLRRRSPSMHSTALAVISTLMA